jgi:site-specific recombinase XerD
MTGDLVLLEPGLTPAQFAGLADVPPDLEWLANITNLKTRRAYKVDVQEFSAFSGLTEPAQLRTVTRAHIIASRKSLEARNLTPASIRRKLSALSSLYEYLCERNAVLGNPVDGVKARCERMKAARPHSAMRRLGGCWRPLSSIR